MDVNNFKDDFKEWVGEVVLTILEFTELEDIDKLSNILNQGEDLKYDGKYIFKNNVINSDGIVKDYKVIGCDDWLEYYGSPCFISTKEKKCILPHLVFKDADTSGNLGYGPSDDQHGRLALTPIISKNLKINKVFVKRVEHDLNTAINENIKIKNLESSEDLETKDNDKKYKDSDLFETIRSQKVHEVDNLYFMNPEGASTLIQAYLDIHFNILNRIEISSPTRYEMVMKMIIETIRITDGLSSYAHAFQVLSYYNLFIPYIRYFIRDQFRNKYTLDNLDKELEHMVISVKSNIEIFDDGEFWEYGTISFKKGCKTKLSKSCKSKNGEDKFIYREHYDAMLFAREDQELYVCPNGLGFHIRTKKNP